MEKTKQTGGTGRATAAARWFVVAAIAAVAVGVFVLRPAARDGGAPAQNTVADAAEVALPRMVDLGADKCVPCKLMAPVLAELKVTYADRLVIEFIDVWKNPDAGVQYGIKLIPTQIFYAADGTELYRHEGFYGREEILAKWRELGVEI
jgi:thioredoxin 1